jgi:hypothetical protein
MNDENLRNNLLSLLLGGIITWFTTRYKPRIERTSDHAEQQQKLIEGQTKTLKDAFDEIDEMRTQQRKTDKYIKAQWVYIIRLLEEYVRLGLVPPRPPKDLESDPEIIRLISIVHDKKTKDISGE